MNTAEVSYLSVCVLSPPPSWSVSDLSLSLSLRSVPQVDSTGWLI